MIPEFTYRVFFAIPFDPAMKSMYTEIRDDLMKEKYGHRLQFVFGTEAVGPSKDFLDMQAFKAQNADLLTQFRSQITSSDIIVADLTSNNPNVHVELGIAITQNKNIVRVSGRNIVEVGSDIKGYFVDQYRDRDDLYDKLKEYIGMFLKIKDQPLDESSPFYKKHPPLKLESPSLQGWGHRQLIRMRDGELKATFNLSQTQDDSDWFGVTIRYPRSSEPWFGGTLIYVRQDGKLETAYMLGGPTSPRTLKQYPPLQPGCDHTLHIRVDGSNLIASLDDDLDNAVEVKDLQNQSFGFVAVACHRSVVHVCSIETVCRDTIDFA